MSGAGTRAADLAAAVAGAARSFRRRPAFFVISTLTLALALTFATSVLSVVDGFTHPPNPFPEPERTFYVMWWGARDKAHPGATGDELTEAVRRADAFDGVATNGVAFQDVRAGDREEQRVVAPVSANFFRVLKLRPRLGRGFLDDDARTGEAVVVSDDLWRSAFQNRPTLAGATITIDHRIHTIVGVMPRGMSYAGPFLASVWTLGGTGEKEACCFLSAHLRPGATWAAANAQLTALAAQLTTTFHVEARPYGFLLRDFVPRPRQLGAMHKAMLTMAFCVLFVACANIASLMLARAVAKRRDLALRLSLGGTQRGLALEQLAEAGILAVAGAGVGLLLATWAGTAMARAIPPEMRWLAMVDPQWSPRLFALVLGAVALATLLTGLLPAWQVARVQPMEPLKDASGGTTGRTAHRMKFVVAAELAVALVLLVGASLMTRSTIRIASFDFGFDAHQLIRASGRFVYRWDLDRFRWADAATEILPRVRATEGVASATTVATGHPGHNQVYSDVTTGSPPPILAGSYLIVGPHFFETTRIRLLAGRDFQEGDAARGAVILDERAVPALFPRGGWLGHRVKLGNPADDGPWLEVIGVAARADLALPENPDGPRWPPIYASIPHQDQRSWEVVARASGDAAAVSLRIDRNLNSLLPRSAAATVKPYSMDYERMVRAIGFVTSLFASLAVASLVLAATGLFAVLAYSVHQRMREFGVRVALGAQRADLLRLVLKDGAEMALAGTGFGAIGVLLGAGVGGQVAFILYGVEPNDPVALVAAEAVLLLVAFGACLVPAFRAMRADPVDVLRAT